MVSTADRAAFIVVILQYSFAGHKHIIYSHRRLLTGGTRRLNISQKIAGGETTLIEKMQISVRRITIVPSSNIQYTNE